MKLTKKISKEKGKHAKKPHMLLDISIVSAFCGIVLIYINFAYFSKMPQLFTMINALAAFIVVGVPLIYRYNEYSRKKKIENTFPIFLRDVTKNISIGMTLPQAIRSAATNDYSSLTPYVKEMSAKISWGIPFERVLVDFAEKIGSTSLMRTVQTINEAHRSGGTVDVVLEAVSESLKEIERIKKERASSVYSQMINGYLIYVIFLGVMIGLSSFLLPTFRFSETMPDLGNVFNEIFRNLIIIQGFFAGLAIGKMAEGTVLAGVKHSIVLVVVGYSAFILLG